MNKASSFQRGEIVRLNWITDESDINAYGTIIQIMSDGQLWVSSYRNNGNISTIVPPSQVTKTA